MFICDVVGCFCKCCEANTGNKKNLCINIINCFRAYVRFKRLR